MKALFYALTLVVVVAAAYFSYDNKVKFEDQLAIRKEAEKQNRTITANLDKTRQLLKDEKATLLAAQEDLAEVNANIDKLAADRERVRRELQEVELELAALQATIDAAAQAMEEAKVLIAAMGVDVAGGVTVENITQIVTDLEDKKKTLIAEIGEIETIIEATENALAKGREEVDRYSRKFAERAAKVRRNAMSSVVTAVDQNWGFVVIGAGRNQGFTPQSRMIIERDGRRIAEVKPSSIEATQTIAEIDYDTITPGVMIQPGDRVIMATARN